jgi:hypothetical protein
VPTYLEWNHALLTYFTGSVPRHSPVRLSVTDDALLDIFSTLFHRPDASADQARDDFLAAVRTECILGQTVRLPRLEFTPSNEPKWVAFLAAMVDAAFRMIDDDDGAGHNYFGRLRGVLALPASPNPEHNRPDGMRILPYMKHAPEAPHWQRWNAWLSERGWIPTATLRQSERRYWSDYPISQTLLRDGDRHRIAGMIEEERVSGRLPTAPDVERIAVFLRRCVARMPKHLQPLIRRENRMDLGRFEELAQEVLELSLSAGSHGHSPKASWTFHTSTRLTAGLYRFEDTVKGIVEYRLFPRQPLRYQGEAIIAKVSGTPTRLERYPPRWFRWLPPVPLHDPPPIEILEHPRLKELALPASTFWVFVRQAGDAGPWATWRRPELGERFLLLCRPLHVSHLQLLREGKLLAWDRVVERNVFGEPWLEYLGCRVESSNWNEINEGDDNAELLAALRPTSRASIHLVGGLPAPDGVGWMVGSPPGVWVCAFQDQVELCVSSLVNEDCELSWKIDANAPNRPFAITPDLPAGPLPAGPYLISARSGSRLLAERVLELRAWEDLAARLPEQLETISLPDHRLCGAGLLPAGR